MHTYLVFIPVQGAYARDALLRDFPNRYELQNDVLWVVATNLATPVEVCQKLGITKQKPTEAPQISSGLVVRFDAYYGMYDPGLWQALDSWNSD